MVLATILSFVLILGLLIVVHKLGHFVVGRALCGASQPMDLDLSLEDTSVWTRTAIVLAGPAANFLLAVVLFWGLLTFVGRPVPPNSTAVGLVMGGFPAAEAGIVTGDLIVAVNGDQVKNWQELTQQIHPRAGQTVRLTVKRDGKRFEVVLTPRAITQQSVGDRTVTVGAIGVAPADSFVTNRLNPLPALVDASKRTAETIVMIIMGMGKVIVGVFSLQTTGGQILMAQMTAPQVQQGFVNMILFTALLSINLGVLNLLPFPFLDGGRLCFLVIEVLQGRPVSLKVLRMAQWVAVALLVVLIMLAVCLAFYDEIFRYLKTL